MPKFIKWNEQKEVLLIIERFFLSNLSIICVTLIIYLLILLAEGFLWIWKLNIEYLTTALWAIIVFWYGYKKYERDKEMSIIDKYTLKYDNIISTIYDQLIDEDNEIKIWFVNYKPLINLWYEEFYLHDGWYISDNLWNEWEYWIKQDIDFLMNKSYEQYLKYIEHNKGEETIESIVRWMGFISCIGFFTKEREEKFLIKSVGGKFLKFLTWIIILHIAKKWFDNEKKDWFEAIKIALIKY